MIARIITVCCLIVLSMPVYGNLPDDKLLNLLRDNPGRPSIENPLERRLQDELTILQLKPHSNIQSNNIVLTGFLTGTASKVTFKLSNGTLFKDNNIVANNIIKIQFSHDGKIYALQTSGLLTYSTIGTAGSFVTLSATSDNYTWIANNIQNFIITANNTIYALNNQLVLVAVSAERFSIYSPNVGSISLNSSGALSATYNNVMTTPIISLDFENAIKQNPSLAHGIFLAYQNCLVNLLYPLSSSLDQDGLALVFAMIVAYEWAPYGLNSRVYFDSLHSAFTNKFLEPVSYTELMLLLYFHVLCNNHNNWKLYWLGWSAGSPFGRHSQIIAIGPNGINLLLDPTIDLVAVVTVDHNLIPISATNVFVWNTRAAPNLGIFTNTILKTTRQGNYSANDLLYVIDASSLKEFNGVTR